MRIYSTVKIAKYFFSFLLVLFTMDVLCPKVYSDTISEASIEKATREVDRKVFPDDMQWAIPRKSEIRGEDGELLEVSGEEVDSSLNDTAESLPPCSPGKLTLRRKL